MITNFKMIKKNEPVPDMGTFYDFMFESSKDGNHSKLHSWFRVDEEHSILEVFHYAFHDVGIRTEGQKLSSEELFELLKCIIESKEIRLRHLLNPYTLRARGLGKDAILKLENMVSRERKQ